MIRFFKTIKPFLPILILYGFTLVLIFRVYLTPIAFQKLHFIGFGILAVSTIVLLINRAAGHLATGLLLLMGTFYKASFTAEVNVNGIKLGFMENMWQYSGHYLLLFVFYLLVNWKTIPIWIKQIFGEKKAS